MKTVDDFYHIFDDVGIIEDFLTVNPYSRPGKKLKGVHGIAIHWTANPGTTAKQNRNFFEMRKDGEHGWGSTHYIVGLRGEVLRMIPDDEWAYHVGGKKYTESALENLGSYPNNCTIGIEMCVGEDGKHPEDTVYSTGCMVAVLCHVYELGVHNVWRHWDVTEKICPRYFVETPGAFVNFLNLVEGYLNEIRDEEEWIGVEK